MRRCVSWNVPRNPNAICPGRRNELGVPIARFFQQAMENRLLYSPLRTTHVRYTPCYKIRRTRSRFQWSKTVNSTEIILRIMKCSLAEAIAKRLALHGSVPRESPLEPIFITFRLPYIQTWQISGRPFEIVSGKMSRSMSKVLSTLSTHWTLPKLSWIISSQVSLSSHFAPRCFIMSCHPRLSISTETLWLLHYK